MWKVEFRFRTDKRESFRCLHFIRSTHTGGFQREVIGKRDDNQSYWSPDGFWIAQPEIIVEFNTCHEVRNRSLLLFIRMVLSK